MSRLKPDANPNPRGRVRGSVRGRVRVRVRVSVQARFRVRVRVRVRVSCLPMHSPLVCPHRTSSACLIKASGLGFGLGVTGYGLRVTGYGSSVTGYGLGAKALGAPQADPRVGVARVGGGVPPADNHVGGVLGVELQPKHRLEPQLISVRVRIRVRARVSGRGRGRGRVTVRVRVRVGHVLLHDADAR